MGDRGRQTLVVILLAGAMLAGGSGHGRAERAPGPGDPPGKTVTLRNAYPGNALLNVYAEANHGPWEMRWGCASSATGAVSRWYRATGSQKLPAACRWVRVSGPCYFDAEITAATDSWARWG